MIAAANGVGGLLHKRLRLKRLTQRAGLTQKLAAWRFPLESL